MVWVSCELMKLQIMFKYISEVSCLIAQVESSKKKRQLKCMEWFCQTKMHLFLLITYSEFLTKTTMRKLTLRKLFYVLSQCISDVTFYRNLLLQLTWPQEAVLRNNWDGLSKCMTKMDQVSSYKYLNFTFKLIFYMKEELIIKKW